MTQQWIGVDLDGTLATYDGWHGPDHIGDPIPEMVDRVKAWLVCGKRVRIFTARACIPSQIPPVERWLSENGLGGLSVTCLKDFEMTELWDDRCIRVESNTGAVCARCAALARKAVNE
jgi:hypothetical protein